MGNYVENRQTDRQTSPML